MRCTDTSQVMGGHVACEVVYGAIGKQRDAATAGPRRFDNIRCMDKYKISREEVVIVAKRFAQEMSVPEVRAIAGAEAWYDAKGTSSGCNEEALRAYLKLRFK